MNKPAPLHLIARFGSYTARRVTFNAYAFAGFNAEGRAVKWSRKPITVGSRANLWKDGIIIACVPCAVETAKDAIKDRALARFDVLRARVATR